MLSLKQLLLPAAILLFLSCKNEHNNTYAIKDFSKSLQPILLKIVSTGIVMNDDLLSQMATDKELVQLGKSEHAVLRALAFREMLDRKSFNHFDLLMNHLDDTALIEAYAGEFGTFYRTVSDDILLNAGWETKEAKSKTIDLVLARHNYLQSAYHILSDISPTEKYYSLIKDMAIRPRRISDGYEMGFGDIEYALYGLAKFKKKEDIIIIKNKLLENAWKLSNISFMLMREFPDAAYLDILQEYHRKRFYQFSGNRRNGFSGFYSDRADPEDFIRALAVQQNDRSALLLDTILNRLPLETCIPDGKNIIDAVVMEIWEHPCPAYTRLREKIEIKAKAILKLQVSIGVPDPQEFVSTTEEPVRW